MNGFPLFQPKAAVDESLVGVEVSSAQFGGIDGVAAFQCFDQLFLNAEAE
jgi:hypothetical protein